MNRIAFGAVLRLTDIPRDPYLKVILIPDAVDLAFKGYPGGFINHIGTTDCFIRTDEDAQSPDSLLTEEHKAKAKSVPFAELLHKKTSKTFLQRHLNYTPLPVEDTTFWKRLKFW